MRQRLVLHAGLHKTGTTFIQRMIAANIEKFAASGVEPAGYFNSEDGNHHKLLLCLKQNRERDFHEALTKQAPTVLVSTEGFTMYINRGRNLDNERIVNEMKETFDIRVVLFRRRQDYLKESVYAEVATNSFTGRIEDENHYPYDFDALLRKFEAAFGKDSISVMVYRDDVKRNLMNDFLIASEIPMSIEDLVEIPPQRVSLHRRKVALLSRVPKKYPASFRKVRQAVEASDKIVDDGIKYQMPPEARLEFLSSFHQTNREVCARYGLTEEETDYLTSQKLAEDKWHAMDSFSDAELSIVSTALNEALPPRS